MPIYKKCDAEFPFGKTERPPSFSVAGEGKSRFQSLMQLAFFMHFGAPSEGSVRVTAKNSQYPWSWGMDNVIPNWIRQGRNFFLLKADTGGLVHLNFTAPARHINLRFELPHCSAAHCYSQFWMQTEMLKRHPSQVLTFLPCCEFCWDWAFLQKTSWEANFPALLQLN